MRLLYITQWFDPEPTILKGPAFVRAIAAAGHEMIVVTGLPNYPTGRIYPGYEFQLFQRETINGVAVERLPLYPSHDQSTFRRALNFLSFFFSSLVYGMLRAGRYDLAYVHHPPITPGLAAALFGKLRGLPFILNIQDLWPDTVAASGMKGTGLLARMLNGACNFVYRRAVHIVIQSDAMRDVLIERGVPPEKLTVVWDWADDALLARPRAPNRAALGPPERFTFVYGGNLGLAQALEHVVRAAKIGADKGGAFDLVLVGDGVEAQALRRLAGEIGASNVRFIDRLPVEEAVSLFEAADALVVHLADKKLFEATVPSKTGFYMAMGKPVLAGVRGAAADILRGADAGLVVPPEDPAAMADAMIEMSGYSAERLAEMGRNGKRHYDQHMTFEIGTNTMIRVIAEVEKAQAA